MAEPQPEVARFARLVRAPKAFLYHSGTVDWKAVAAEFVALCFLVIVGCGSAVANGAFDGATTLLVAFGFGMGILVLAYTIAHHSGAQINCAVTFSLVLGGVVTWQQGIANLCAQCAGSVLGALFLWGIFPCSQDQTTNLGSNIVNPDFGDGKAFLGEFVFTTLLCYVVWETAVSSKSTCGNNACIAIGFAVFLAHIFLIPIDGCSINPTRSFGPAVMSAARACPNNMNQMKPIKQLWIFLLAPLAGGAMAALIAVPFGARPPVKPDEGSCKGNGDGTCEVVEMVLPVEAAQGDA